MDKLFLKKANIPHFHSNSRKVFGWEPVVMVYFEFSVLLWSKPSSGYFALTTYHFVFLAKDRERDSGDQVRFRE